MHAGRFELTIMDQGPGIQRAGQARLFWSFGAEASGTGPALSITQRFMEAKPGIIAVEPMDPQGTRI
jgi:K+-sensing histidine kinase KdpD